MNKKFREFLEKNPDFSQERWDIIKRGMHSLGYKVSCRRKAYNRFKHLGREKQREILARGMECKRKSDERKRRNKEKNKLWGRRYKLVFQERHGALHEVVYSRKDGKELYCANIEKEGLEDKWGRKFPK